MMSLEDRIYAWLLKRGGRGSPGKVLAKNIVAKLCGELSDEPVSIRRALGLLSRDGRVEYTAAANGEPVSSYITFHRPIPLSSAHAQCWDRILDKAELSAVERLALRPLHVHLEGFSEADMTCLLQGLQDLREAQAEHAGEYNFSVSAKYLLGSSKLLSKFDGRHLKAFGIDTDLFQDRLPYVVVGGNGTNYEAVILIENPISFEMAVQSDAAKRCAFICTFGFGLSNQGNEFGYQLAGMVETGKAVTLRRSEGSFPEFAQLLRHPQCHFWGDLDSAGMHIYMRLKRRLPLLQLSALYWPMIESLKQVGKCHPYVTSTGKLGQTAFGTGDADALELGRLCITRSVCQESVRTADIKRLAGLPLVTTAAIPVSGILQTLSAEIAAGYIAPITSSFVKHVGDLVKDVQVELNSLLPEEHKSQH